MVTLLFILLYSLQQIPSSSSEYLSKMSLIPSKVTEHRKRLLTLQSYANSNIKDLNSQYQQSYHPHPSHSQTKNAPNCTPGYDIEEVSTPSWAKTYKYPQQLYKLQNNLYSQKQLTMPHNPHRNIIPNPVNKIQRLTGSMTNNMSRLDELFSKNQLISQTMRNQLQEISRSNQNIKNNINNIKPLYQSQQSQQIKEEEELEMKKQKYGREERNAEEELDKYEFIEEYKEDSSSFKEAFTFTEHKRDQQLHLQSQGSHTSSRKSTEMKRSKNSPYLQKQPKIIIIQPKQLQEKKRKSISEKYHIKTSEKQQNNNLQPQEYSHSNSLTHQIKKQMHRISKFHDRSSSYHQPDSSPVASEMFLSIEQKIRSQGKNVNLNGHKSKINETKNKDMYTIIEKEKYETFEEQGETNAQLTTNKSAKALEKEKTMKIKEPALQILKLKSRETIKPTQNPQSKECKSSQSYYNSDATQLKYLTSPSQISLAFIPFNKLYSSPILQLSNKKQLILARKSKTQIVANNSTNRTINGIKYKNVNLVHDEVKLYEIIVNHARKVQQVLSHNMEVREYLARNMNMKDGCGLIEESEIELHKNNVDIGIIGGQNTLKKKIHFSLIAHIYADIIQFLESYLQSYLIETQQEHNLSQSENGSFKSSPNSIILGIEHQEQQSLGDPYMIKYEGQIKSDSVQNQIVFANIKAAIQEIHTCMKMKLNTNEAGNNNEQDNEYFGHGYGCNNIHNANMKNLQLRNYRIRVTKFYLKLLANSLSQPQSNIFENEQDHPSHSLPSGVSKILYSNKIISTNKISKQLIQSLDLDSVIWCINPMYKYYEDTKQCLECYNEYKNYIANQNKYGREK